MSFESETTQRIAPWRACAFALLAAMLLTAGPVYADERIPDQPDEITATEEDLPPGEVVGLDENGVSPESAPVPSFAAARRDEPPWAEGVSADDQALARELFEEANRLMDDALFSEAAALYREALEHWQHPRLSFNLALALMEQERAIAAYRAFGEALRYGVAGLEAERFELAERYRALLAKQIAELHITCDEPGAEVALDGEVVLQGPGEYRDLVLVGAHRVVASKPGYAAVTRSLVLAAGDERAVALKLLRLDQLTREVTPSGYKWGWITLGTGAALASVGGLLSWRSLDGYARYDAEVAARCPEGCSSEEQTAFSDIRTGAERDEKLALAAYVAGGAAAMAGLVLAYVYRPYSERVSVGGDEGEDVAIEPRVTPDMVGVSAVFRF